MTGKSPDENDNEVASETAVYKATPDRRGLFRRLLALAGLGITGVLLSQEKAGLLPAAHADSVVYVDGSVLYVIEGRSTASSGTHFGVNGNVLSSDGVSAGVIGVGNGMGVYGKGGTTQVEGVGVTGYSGTTEANVSSALGSGVYGETMFGDGYGVKGVHTGGGTGVYGETDGASAGAVTGHATSTTGANAGVSGFTDSSGGYGVYGKANGPGGTGVCGLAGAYGIGVTGQALTPTCVPLLVQGASGQTANLQQWQGSSGSAWSVLSVVDANGNLGVGTASPVSPVEVAGLVKSSLGSALGQPAINASSMLCAARDTWTVGEFSSHSTSGNPQFYFYRSRGKRTALAAVAAGDYIGSLLGNAYDGSAWGGPSGVAQIRFAIDGTPGTGSLPTYIMFATTPSGSNTPTERMRITNTGQVGIGTTSPTHLIQLAGGAYSDGSTWNPSSSVRWKENIQPLTDGVNTLKQLHPVAYNYKKTPAKRTMGFIAEEVGKVLPSVVDWDKAEPNYAEGYDQTAILALTVEAVKEQQRTIEKLTTQNQELVIQNQALNARIEALEKFERPLVAS